MCIGCRNVPCLCKKIADFGVSAQITATLAKRKSFIGSPYWFVFLCIAIFRLSFKSLALIFGKL